MTSSPALAIAADAVLLVHALFVVFVVVGLLAVVVGKLRNWRWVRNPWFRVGHLAAIGIVVGQSWLGVVCPLTTLELALRRRAGEAGYAGSFVAHWVEQALYIDAPPWAFAVVYTAFGLGVIAAWRWVAPRRFGADPVS